MITKEIGKAINCGLARRSGSKCHELTCFAQRWGREVIDCRDFERNFII